MQESVKMKQEPRTKAEVIEKTTAGALAINVFEADANQGEIGRAHV